MDVMAARQVGGVRQWQGARISPGLRYQVEMGSVLGGCWIGLGSLLSPGEPWVTELEPAGYEGSWDPDHSSRVPSSVSHAWRDSGPDAKLPDQ